MRFSKTYQPRHRARRSSVDFSHIGIYKDKSGDAVIIEFSEIDDEPTTHEKTDEDEDGNETGTRYTTL